VVIGMLLLAVAFVSHFYDAFRQLSSSILPIALATIVNFGFFRFSSRWPCESST
jgi:hypothetical protein